MATEAANFTDHKPKLDSGWYHNSVAKLILPSRNVSWPDLPFPRLSLQQFASRITVLATGAINSCIVQ